MARQECKQKRKAFAYDDIFWRRSTTACWLKTFLQGSVFPDGEIINIGIQSEIPTTRAPEPN